MRVYTFTYRYYDPEDRFLIQEKRQVKAEDYTSALREVMANIDVSEVKDFKYVGYRE
jgi:hypothetical protein